MKISYQFKPADFSKTMKNLAADYEKEIKEAIVVATRQTSLNAKSFIPVDKGGLKASVRVANMGLTGEVTAGAEYAPYVEFGTGSKVNVPSELKDYAIKFKGKGIRKVNTRSQPYLYPAFFINREKFIIDMDRRINKIANKNWR